MTDVVFVDTVDLDKKVNALLQFAIDHTLTRTRCQAEVMWTSKEGDPFKKAIVMYWLFGGPLQLNEHYNPPLYQEFIDFLQQQDFRNVIEHYYVHQAHGIVVFY